MKHRVTLYALTMPPSPMLYQEFDTRSDALAWRAWARRELPCHARLTKANTETAPIMEQGAPAR